MLWHGCRPTQVLDLLKNGLKTPINSAPSVGYMFGKGIYFTDTVSKAATLSFVKKIDKECILLLCDVAIGEEYRLVKPKVLNKPPKPYHSVLGVGRYAPPSFLE